MINTLIENRDILYIITIFGLIIWEKVKHKFDKEIDLDENIFELQNEDRTNELKRMEYKTYLSTKEWKAKSKIRKDLDSKKCMLCNNKFNLNVHHNTYKRKGYEQLNDLITLCNECHNNFHKTKKIH